MEVRCKKRLRKMASSSFDDCPETKKVCGIKGVMNGVKGRVFSDRFDYEENKQTISALASELEMTQIPNENSSESLDLATAFYPLNENFGFEQTYVSREMYLQYRVQLSNHLPVYIGGAVVIINETQEFRDFQDVLMIENSNGAFLAEQYEYRAEVVIRVFLERGIFQNNYVPCSHFC
jgi:hypothetical protein